MMAPIVIDDFLDPTQCKFLIGLGLQQSKSRTGIQNDLRPEWKSVNNFDIDGELSTEIANVHQRIGQEIALRYGVEVTPREDGYFYEYEEGDFYLPHCDSQKISQSPIGTTAFRKISSADVSSVLYLNGDIEGGDIEFVFSGRRVKPQTGRLLLFYGGWQNAHRVHEIEKGKRYAIVNWFISQPHLVPSGEVIPSPYGEAFMKWQSMYQTGQTIAP